MKELLEKLAWKKCHITTVNTKFEFVTIIEVSDRFVAIETEDKEKMLINLDFVRFVNEAKEGTKAPVFVPHDL